jgi:hypothetical protein
LSIAHKELLHLRAQIVGMRRGIVRLSRTARFLRSLLPTSALMELAEEARGLADDLEHGAGERARPPAKTVIVVRGARPLIRR